MLSLINYIEKSEETLQRMRGTNLAVHMEEAAELLVGSLNDGKPALICGNGGSASDAEHIAGELVGRFLKNRKAYNVISLVSNSAVVTAWSNDFEYETVFSRQVEGHGAPGGVLIAISTSGNSVNVTNAAIKAKELGMHVIAFTGKGGGKLAEYADVLLDIPSQETPQIQQGHITLYHYLCYIVEERLTALSE